MARTLQREFSEELNSARPQMEGSTFSWTELLKDPDYFRFSEEFPDIYTNHWLNNEKRFRNLQMPYWDKHVNKIMQCLNLSGKDVFADLTDNDHTIAAAIRKKIQFENNSFCVGKPFRRLAECVSDPELVPLYSDSRDVCLNPEYFRHFDINKVLFTNETLNLYKNDITAALKLLSKHMPHGSKVLLTYRPEHTYLPLFEQARLAMAKSQLSTESMRSQIRSSGLDQIRIEVNHYDTKIEKETWFAMLRARYFPWLADFTAEEIENGIEVELAPKYCRTELIQFKETFVYLTVDLKKAEQSK